MLSVVSTKVFMTHLRVDPWWCEQPCILAALGVTVALRLNHPAPICMSEASAAAAAAAAQSLSVTFHRTASLNMSADSSNGSQPT